MRKAYSGIAAVVVWAALILQFYVSRNITSAQGQGLAEGLVSFLSYFTILTNVMVAAALTLPLVAGRTTLGAFFARPVVHGGIASYIALVGIVYGLLLRHLRPTDPVWYIADVTLHDVIPIAFVAHWLMFVDKGALRWRHAIVFLWYPLVYVTYALARGAFTGRYPYWFIDATQLGYARVFANMAGLTLAFLVLGLVFVGIDRMLAPRQERAFDMNP